MGEVLYVRGLALKVRRLLQREAKAADISEAERVRQVLEEHAARAARRKGSK